MAMHSPWQQYSLPIQRPRASPESRPHTVHASSSTFRSKEQALEQAHTPRASLTGLGILPEAAERRLSRDDTAADVSELLPEHGSSPFSEPEEQIAPDDVSDVRVSEDIQFGNFAAPRASRPSVFRLPATFTANSGESSESGGTKPASLGRRFSRSYKDRFSGLKENMSKNVSRIRRSSTPQLLDVNSHISNFGTRPIVPTSPSKRNKHDGDRPFRLRQFQKQNDRKDTPAPPPFALTRPGSRNAPPDVYSMPGGERARMAAAAFRFSPHFFIDNTVDERDDLNARRSRLGSQPCAADSGADLTQSYGSNELYKDADGDIEMLSPEEPEDAPRDPLKLLPSEVCLQIFEYLDASDLVKAELVCSTWRAIALKKSVWRTAFLRNFQRQIYTNPPPIQVGGAGCGRPNRPNQEWKKMFKARKEVEANWRKGAPGAGKAIYLSGHTDSVYCLQFDEEKIITGSRDRTIRVWDINNFTCQRVIGGPNVKPVVGPKVLRTVDYPDFHLATASVNGTAYGNTIYNVPSQWHDASILCLQYDDEILVTGSSDSDLLVWDIKTYQPIQRLSRHTGGVLDVALDSKHIVSCSKDSKIIVWDRETYEPKGELTGHRGPVNAVQLRGNLLVSASGDGIARLWDLGQMKLVKEFSAKERGLAAVEFSEDMNYVLAGGNDTITYKFETETGKEVKQFTGHSQLVRSLWLDSQNNRVVSGSYDLDLRVYDFESGQEIWRAEEWTTSWMLAAKSDYRRIVATSQDGRILIIDFGLQKLRDPDDGQPIENVDLLRGTDNTNAIQWRNPWELARQRELFEQQEREREREEREREQALMQEQLQDVLMT